MNDLSPDKAAALARIGEFLRDPARKLFVLHGLAGTGKTWLLTKYLAAALPRVYMCAPTNKAAKNLMDDGEFSVSTVHSMILYPVETKKKDARGRDVIEWGDKPFYGDLVLLDECSMIDTELRDKLLGKCNKLIAFGDPGQLPPVNGTPGFDLADFALTTNFRQQEGSGIVNQALAVRDGQPYRTHGPEFECLTRGQEEVLLRSDIALCYRNDNRQV